MGGCCLNVYVPFALKRYSSDLENALLDLKLLLFGKLVIIGHFPIYGQVGRPRLSESGRRGSKMRPLELLRRKLAKSDVGRASANRAGNWRKRRGKEDSGAGSTKIQCTTVESCTVSVQQASSTDVISHNSQPNSSVNDNSDESESEESGLVTANKNGDNEAQYCPPSKRPRSLRVSLTLPPSVDTSPLSSANVRSPPPLSSPLFKSIPDTAMDTDSLVDHQLCSEEMPSILSNINNQLDSSTTQEGVENTEALESAGSGLKSYHEAINITTTLSENTTKTYEERDLSKENDNTVSPMIKGKPPSLNSHTNTTTMLVSPQLSNSTRTSMSTHVDSENSSIANQIENPPPLKSRQIIFSQTSVNNGVQVSNLNTHALQQVAPPPLMTDRIESPVIVNSCQEIEKPPPLKSAIQTVIENPPPLKSATQTVAENPPPLKSATHTVMENPPPLKSATQTVMENPPPLKSTTQTVIENPPPLKSTMHIVEHPPPLKSATQSVIEKTSLASTTQTAISLEPQDNSSDDVIIIEDRSKNAPQRPSSLPQATQTPVSKPITQPLSHDVFSDKTAQSLVKVSPGVTKLKPSKFKQRASVIQDSTSPPPLSNLTSPSPLQQLQMQVKHSTYSEKTSSPNNSSKTLCQPSVSTQHSRTATVQSRSIHSHVTMPTSSPHRSTVPLSHNAHDHQCAKQNSVVVINQPPSPPSAPVTTLSSIPLTHRGGSGHVQYVTTPVSQPSNHTRQYATPMDYRASNKEIIAATKPKRVVPERFEVSFY